MKHDARFFRLIVHALVSAFARRPFCSLRRLGAGRIRIRNPRLFRGERVFGNLEEVSDGDLRDVVVRVEGLQERVPRVCLLYKSPSPRDS